MTVINCNSPAESGVRETAHYVPRGMMERVKAHQIRIRLTKYSIHSESEKDETQLQLMKEKL